MLGNRADSALRESLYEASTERTDRRRIEMQRAVADHRAAAVVEVEHGREAKVDAMRAELGCNHVADRGGKLARLFAVAVPLFAQRAHRRDRGEALLEALHPPAFVVHAYRQRRLPLPFDIGGERGKLLGVFVIAREENHRARRGMADALAVFLGQHRAEHIHYHRPGRQPYFSHSRITVAKATPFSSESETWALVTPLVFSNFCNASENSSTGLPEARLRTQTPCQFAGDLMPVPSALVNASFAAKRFAR